MIKTTLKSLRFFNNKTIKFYSDDTTRINKVTKCKGTNKDPEELGQPTFWTHPHLFHTSNASDFNKQVTPGITKSEFEKRRNDFVEQLANYQSIYFSSSLTPEQKHLRMLEPFHKYETSNDCNFIAVIPSSLPTFMSPDVPNTFKQNSDFFYLTGFKEPHSVLVISQTDSSSNYRTCLFVKDKDPNVEIWEGPCTGPKNISKLCGIENALSIREFKSYMFSLLKETNANKRITLWRYPTEHVFKESGPYCHNEMVEDSLNEFISQSNSTSNKLIDMINQEPINSSTAASYFNSSRYFVQINRVKKSNPEIELMRRACDISSKAFENSITVSHPFINEHLLYAKFDYDCRIRGAEYLAYIPVIAGGSRATSLHYIRNNQIVRNDELILMDAGCQLNDYASDITRTWPVGGKYKNTQRELYEACLNIQKYCINKCAPGISIQQLYFTMMRKMAEELTNLNLLDKNEYDSIIKPTDLHTDPLPGYYLRKLTKFCPHDVGHYLGLDVHDCPEVSKLIELEPNMVITIEPGIYVKSNDESVPYKYRGIGIRIEDDVVITENGCDILSKMCPKEITDIEKLKN